MLKTVRFFIGPEHTIGSITPIDERTRSACVFGGCW